MTTIIKNEYLDNLIRTAEPHPPEAIQALKQFKKGYKFPKYENFDKQNPDHIRKFNNDMVVRLMGMQSLIVELSKIYNIPFVKVQAIAIHPNGTSGNSCYRADNNTITMTGKLSIITLLHEFGHALKGESEDTARQFSISLFRTVYPKAFEKLKAKDKFFLTDRPAPADVLPNISRLTGETMQTAEASPTPAEIATLPTPDTGEGSQANVDSSISD